MLVWLFAVVIGAVAIEAIEAFMDRSKALPICDQITATRSLWTVLLGGMALVGIWVAHLAQRSLQSNQWPLPGTWVPRVVLVRGGELPIARRVAAMLRELTLR